MVAKRNPRWSRDEIILALDLYFRLNGKGEDGSNEEVILLSRRLQLLSPAESKMYNKYRNENAVTLKLHNLRFCDPERMGGMPGGSKLDKAVLQEFYQEREQLYAIAQSIIRSLDFVIPEEIEDDTDGVPEGRRLKRLHFMLERNGKLVKRKKSQELAKHGKLACIICNFDFQAIYGNAGQNFIECHHIVPLSQLAHPSLTKLKDYLLLCANCHRMIHKTQDCNVELLKAAMKSAAAKLNA